MEITELSLAPNAKFIVERRCNSSSSESEAEAEYNSISRSSKKRKFSTHDYQFLKPSTSSGPPIHTSVDLHVKDPLPLDWEQCLDLESGKMFYLNRKTLRKSWELPKDQKLDLELNISSPNSDNHHQYFSSSNSVLVQESKQQLVSSTSNMIALACLNCHLLVILSKSSPSCPNCKFIHSLPIAHRPPIPKFSPATKFLNTLSL